MAISVKESKILPQIADVLDKINPKLVGEVKFAINTGASLKGIYQLIKSNLDPEKEAQFIETLSDVFYNNISIVCDKSVDVKMGEEKNLIIYVANNFDIPLSFDIELNSKESGKELIFDESSKTFVRELHKNALIEAGSRSRFRFVVSSKDRINTTLYWIVSLEEFPYIRKVDKTTLSVN